MAKGCFFGGRCKQRRHGVSFDLGDNCDGHVFDEVGDGADGYLITGLEAVGDDDLVLIAFEHFNCAGNERVIRGEDVKGVGVTEGVARK